MDIMRNAHAKRINGRYHALKGKMFSSSSTRIEILKIKKHGTQNESQVATVAHNHVHYLDNVEMYIRGADFGYEHFVYVYFGTFEPRNVFADCLP